MSRYHKVVWQEGMLLTPHHFQQWDNYYEDLLNSRLSSLVAYEWGVLDLKINQKSIENGYFTLTRCSAITPDGLLLDIPQTSPTPEARNVEGHFPATAESVDVYLAVPSQRTGAPNFQMDGDNGGQMARYLQMVGKAVDETTGDNERQLAFARGNLKVLFTDEMGEGFNAIKIAELKRTTTGQLTISEDYIPPCLNISSSPWLVDRLGQLVEVLITKSSVLGDQRRQRTTSLADFTTSEVAAFWLLHTVNSAIPGLAHLFHTRLVHPERLYVELIRLAGGLMTFSNDLHPKSIVRYDHKNLYFTFSQLFDVIRGLLETVIPTRCVPIQLEKKRDTLYVGRVQDDRLLKEAEFFLAVHAQLAESKLIEYVPRLIKIASRDKIDAVVGAGLEGVVLKHTSAHAAIPIRTGFQYFKLDSFGYDWDLICGSKNIAVYMPEEFPEVRLEMYAIKP
jgi:type VI secretion system protein ImpJ